MSASPAPRRPALSAVALGGAVLCALAFGAAAGSYDDFRQPQTGGFHVPVNELAFDLWYLVYGLAFVALLAAALRWSGVVVGLFARGWRALEASPLVPGLLAVLVGASAAAFRAFVLERQVITDDEEVYRFIAQTLALGRVVNPLPEDWRFFQNQFVVMNAHGWYGKYPIGHPLLLMLGMKVGLFELVVPILGGVTAWLTFAVGRRLLGRRRALLGTLLLLASPHFVWTHGTLLSQPATALGLMLGLWAFARARGSPKPMGWTLLGSSAFAFATLCRPAPGALFVALGALAAISLARARPGIARGPLATAFLVPVAVVGAVLLLVQQAQSGSALTSGYQEAHGGLGIGVLDLGMIGQSVLGGALRENFWLLGWPLSLAPLLFARFRRGRLLLWGPVIAELLYRLLVPKTVVSTTGPTYLLEAVPVLALLVADGLCRASLWLEKVGVPRANELVAALGIAAVAAAAIFFIPVELATVRTAVLARELFPSMIEEKRLESALIFTGPIVPKGQQLTWAYFPPSPSPTLDDRVMVVRWPRGDDALAKATEFWRRRFPDRPAFVFQLDPEPELVPLEQFGGPPPPAKP